MDPEQVQRWREADRLFGAWLDVPEAQRVEWLADQSLSAPLHDALQRLIEQHLKGDPDLPALDRVVLTATQVEVPRNLLAGRCFGSWELIEEIGRGGMSVVYKAHHAWQPERLAALKLVTLGTLVGAGLERFQREQSILARLSHAHIVPLFDAGVAEDGTPWLAMALVDGQRIDAWCAGRGHNTRARVNLLLQVCDAVTYAHQNLVIHRDIKPSNVLVDAQGEVRLLDFGIARIVDEASEQTASAYRALTPGYAAPEQFTGAPAATTMDVYGLGALLRALLDRARSGDSDRPAHDAGNAIDADLTAILARALNDRISERYPTVDALARDLRRWLAQEPVEARHPSLGYVIARFARRHAKAVATAALLLMAITGGVAATLWQAERATTEAARARTEALRARQVLDLLTESFQINRAGTSRSQALRVRERVANAIAAVGGSLDEDPELLLRLAQISASLGMAAEAERLAARIDAIPADATASTVERLATAALLRGRSARDRGEPVVAESHLRRGLDLLASYPALEPQRARIEENLGWVLSLQGRGDEAETMLRSAVERQRMLGDRAATAAAMEVLGVHYRSRLQLEAAERTLDECLALRRQLYGETHREIAVTQSLLGGVYDSQRRYTRAVEARRSAVNMERALYGEVDGATLDNLASTLLKFGDYRAAVETGRKALSVQRAQVPPESPSLANLGRNLGIALQRYGELGEAEPMLATSVALYERTRGATDPWTQRARLQWFDLRVALASDPAPAEAVVSALETLRAAGGGYRALFPAALAMAARIEAARGDRARALTLLDEADERIAASPIDIRDPLEPIDYTRGMLALAAGDSTGALAAFERADAELRTAVADDHPLRCEIELRIKSGRGESGLALQRAELCLQQALSPRHPLRRLLGPGSRADAVES